jgi:site-specific recombinase XerD
MSQPNRSLAGRPGHNSGRRYPPEILSAAEVAALMAAMNKGATGERNRALVAVLYRAGLRLSEALALKPADVDTGAGTIRVLAGKGRKARTVGIDDGGLLYLERWLARRETLGLARRRLLFTGLSGTPWSAQAVRQMLSYAACRAGIAKRVHPHGFRHTHAAELSAEGVPVAVIQRQLGHTNLAVTSRYLDHIAPAEVIALGRSRTWEVAA